MNRCSIIIPVYNHGALTQQCLAAVRQTVPADVEIIVVDDGSTEDTGELDTKVIRQPVNGGFATACNAGAGAARSEWLVFLNNDTIPQPGWLAALVDYAAQHPKAAVVGSKLLYPTSKVQHAGVVICQDRHPRHIYTGFPSAHPAVNQARRFQIVTAACALVKREAFVQAGGFDTAYRNGFEDVELCLRLGELGHEIHYCPASVVTHLESVSEGRFRQADQNLAIYRQRWLDRVQPDDLKYYVADGLLRFAYEGQFPLRLTVSPLLASVGLSETDHLLRQRASDVQDLTRENTRLSMELGRVATNSPELQYQRMRDRLVEIVLKTVPVKANVLVVSKGDGALLKMTGRVTGHFPQLETGVYAGHHLADSNAAITHLDQLHEQGAEYLVFPASAFWWLDHYAQFKIHLETSGQRIWSDAHCIIYRLKGEPEPAAPIPLVVDEKLVYQQMIRRLRQTVRDTLPADSTVLVVSKGDDELLRLDAHKTQHFPQTRSGAYTGYHPGDSAEAIAQLESLRQAGAMFLVIPGTAFWWLEHYREFGDYLSNKCHRILWQDDTCAIYALDGDHYPATDGTATQRYFNNQLRGFLQSLLPPGARLAVANAGDPVLIAFNGLKAEPFPSNEAPLVPQLEELRAGGIEYLVIPQPAFDWLKADPALQLHLDSNYRCLARQQHLCVIYSLSLAPKEPRS